VFLKDIDGRFITVNSRFEELLGITRDDVRGKTDYDILTRERADYYRAHDQQILTTGQPMQIEELALLADGKEHTFLANKFPLFDASGKPYAVCAISVDITERKRVEEALRASELRFRLALTNAPVSVAMQDCDLVYRWAYNQRTRTPEEIIGKTDADLFAPAEIPAILKVKRRVLRTGAPEHVQQWITSDGQRLFADLYYEPLRGGDGEIVGLGIAVVDLTRRKLAEEQIDKLSRILKARSQSDQAILHATDEQTFLEEVCRIITLDCGHSMVWIGVAEHDEHKGVRPVAYSGFAEGYLETQGITWDESERGRGPTGTAIRTGRPSMCRNMLTDPAFAPWRDDAVEHGYASSLVIPLKDENKAWGAITIYSREPDSFSKGEVDLLVELAKDLEFGIQTLRMRAAHARAEQLLRENEKLLGLFIEHAPAALAMFDRHMRYLHASRRWREDYNLGDRNLSGISHYDVIPEMPEAWKNAHRRGLAGEVLYGDAERFERADGSVQWIRWEIRPWLNAEGAVGGIVIFSEDITRHKEADAALMQGERLAVQHEQLQALAQRLQEAREEERKTVARDLHDDIGQILTAIKMDMTWMVRHLPNSKDDVHERLEGSIELINDGVQSVRRICSGLRPGVLDDLGLAAAIEWQANEFASRTGISITLSLPPAELQLDGDRSTVIFRIFQECLTNVARHAEAEAVRTSLYEEGEDLLLAVQDDGKGFRESEVAGSLGLLGMKERAQACGGSVQVSSRPGQGTTVTVRVPLCAANVEREDHANSDSR
jgi:PAS domain S-box-containing protein